jgi:hypothetical protein
VFNLSEAQCNKVNIWRREQDAIVAKQQGKNAPYYGASGGEVTYMFTPTTIGCVMQVKHAMTESVLDISDYDSW